MFGDKESYMDKFKTCTRCRPFGKQSLGQEFYCKEHTKPLFKKHEIMTVHNLYIYHCFIGLLKILKFHQPISLFSAFKLSPLKETRIKLTQNFIRWFKPSNHNSNNFIYKSAILWNHLEGKLHILDFAVNVNSVKTKLKSLILSNQSNLGKSIEWSDCNFNVMT